MLEVYSALGELTHNLAPWWGMVQSKLYFSAQERNGNISTIPTRNQSKVLRVVKAG